jgi:hypothetical protein
VIDLRAYQEKEQSMPTKRDQEGRTKTSSRPPAAEPKQDAAAESPQAQTRTDESWKQNFPQAAAAGASRDEYQQTADQRRVQAERTSNLELAAEKEQERKSEVNGDPIPTGESDNPHDKEPAVDPVGDAEAEPDVDSPPEREIPKT